MVAGVSAVASAMQQGVCVQRWFSPSALDAAVGLWRELTERGLDVCLWRVERKAASASTILLPPESVGVLPYSRSRPLVESHYVVAQSAPAGKQFKCQLKLGKE